MRVSVGSGSWRIVANDPDTKFDFYLNDDPPTTNPDFFVVIEHLAKLHVVITTPGTKLLDISIESIHAPLPS